MVNHKHVHGKKIPDLRDSCGNLSKSAGKD